MTNATSTSSSSLSLPVSLKDQAAKIDHLYPINADEAKFIQDLEQMLIELGNEEVRKMTLGFFKTEPGQYGYGDEIIGIRVPVLRKLMTPYLKLESSKSLAVIHHMLSNKWHEVRFCALVALNQLSDVAYKKMHKSQELTQNSQVSQASVIKHSALASTEEQRAELQRLCKFYVEHAYGVNNWDLVDISAPQLIGNYLNTLSPEEKSSYLEALAHSSNLWIRRMALVGNMKLIKAGEVEPIIKLAPLYMDSKHDLLHKALGWMLREVGKADKKSLTSFLDEYAAIMPRTALRYALERLDSAEKKYFMTLKPKAQTR